MNYYEVPTQVEFWSVDNNSYMGGIAFGENVICGCCGNLFKITEIYSSTPEDIVPIKAFKTWIDINEEIKGE